MTKDLPRYRRYTFYKENKIKDLFPDLTENCRDFLMKLLVWDPKVVSSNQETNECSEGITAPLFLRETPTKTT